MALLRHLAFLGMLAPRVIAQDSSDDDVKVWAAVAYINHGEKTPSLASLNEALTPIGAQQLYRQGTAFRSRYLNTTGDASSAQIAGIETEWIDNLQIDALVAEDEWVVGGALAFFQGLYPPTEGYSDMVGGNDFGRDLTGNQSEGDWIEFPLQGYQYPQLQTLSSLDSESPSVQGTVGCDAWRTETNIPLKQRKEMQDRYDDNIDFYRDLFSSDPLQGTLDEDYPNFWNAYEIYEFVNYMYSHNQTVHDSLEDANATLAKLEENAFALQQAKNQEPEKGSDKMDELYTIAGRTLAMKVADQLQRNLDWDGKRDKLSVLFGSQEPLLAFLSVAGLLTRSNTVSGSFNSLPQPGASLVFELIGEPTDSDTPPDTNDLRIRFLYRASADEGEEFEGYSLFGSGYGGKSIPYTAFYREMTEAGVTSEEWCDVCSPSNAPWCPDSSSSPKDNDDSDGSGDGILTSKSRLHPALAGLIGALIMGFLIGIVALGLFMLGGFRIARKSPEERRSSSGFKGREKREDDPDVAVGARGQQQERVGSWEMRDGEGDHVGFAGKGLGIQGARDMDGDKDGDGGSVFGATIVNPRESV